MDRNIFCNFENLGAVEVRLKKGEIYPPHDHPDKTVFCYVAKGKIQIDSFDIVKEIEGGFELKKVSTEVACAGEHSSLTPRERNVHTVTGLEDSTFIDTYTPNCPEVSGLNFYRLEPVSGDIYHGFHISLEEAFS